MRAARRRVGATAASVAAHGAVLAAVLTVAPAPTRLVEPDVIPVEMVAPRYLAPPPPPKPAPTPKPEPKRTPPPEDPKLAERPPPPRLKVRPPRRPPPADVATLDVAPTPVADPAESVSEAELASAATAGSGGGGAGDGAGCDMAGWLQRKLRADARVRTALAATPHERAIRIWNGDWIRHGDQEGAGLAAVREAIMWEVAFAPAPCRTQPVRGLVLLTLNDGPSPARVVVGRSAWRWSDLLFARGERRGGG